MKVPTPTAVSAPHASASFSVDEALFSSCIRALAQADARLRMRAYVWLADHAPRYVDPLIAVARTHPDLYTRLAVLDIFVETRSLKVIPVLAELLKDPEPAVRLHAKCCLEKLSQIDLNPAGSEGAIGGAGRAGRGPGNR